ncbi:hypothetical protein B0H67DRAFT_557070 [Lasiosphaeris hirsuta]|uniref:SET domain-containing protein n=1 Tax=Lasiosphaeris hirsuta TaxID=260670 RepID=A0AA40DPF8_9PEZI|nr:hypothetical protein B0H67DRAFT_557070 [Lasiosphaeris hirsuta]
MAKPKKRRATATNPAADVPKAKRRKTGSVQHGASRVSTPDPGVLAPQPPDSDGPKSGQIAGGDAQFASPTESPTTSPTGNAAESTQQNQDPNPRPARLKRDSTASSSGTPSTTSLSISSLLNFKVGAKLPTPTSQPSEDPDPAPTNRDATQPIFEFTTVEGKGRGLIARIAIRIGQCIVEEKPLLQYPLDKQLPDLQEEIEKTIDAMPDATKEEWQSLTLGDQGLDIEHPMATMAKAFALPSAHGFGAVFSTISLVNHHCSPNAHYNWDAERGVGTLYSGHKIEAGKEITVSYVDYREPYHRRWRAVKRRFDFECNCDTCQLVGSEAGQLSDGRRTLIQRLFEGVRNEQRIKEMSGQCLDDCHDLMEILKQEFPNPAWILLAETCSDALRVVATHSDTDRAVEFVKRAHRSFAKCEGLQAEHVAELEMMMKDVTGHKGWGACCDMKCGYRDRFGARPSAVGEMDEERLSKKERKERRERGKQLGELWLWGIEQSSCTT